MRSKSKDISRFAGPLVAAVLTVLPWAGCGQPSRQPKVQSAPKVSVDKDGTIHLPAFGVPLSSYMSEHAKQTFVDQALNPPAPLESTATISQRREAVDKWYRAKVERAKAIYPVNIEEQKMLVCGRMS